MTPFSLRAHFDEHPPKNARFHTIAIDGRGGSGKTTLAQHLSERYPGMTFVKGDDYFEPDPTVPTLGAHDEALFIRDVIEPLRAGDRFRPRRYDWARDEWTAPIDVVVREAFCLDRCFAFESGLDWDVRIWVEVSPAAARERAIRREASEGWVSVELQREAWRLWQLREDDYIARIRPRETATVVLDGTRPWGRQIH